MRRFVVGLVLTLGLVLMFGACGDPATTTGAVNFPNAIPLGDAAASLQAAQAPLRRAFDRLEVRDWEGCLEPFEEAIAHLEPHPLLGGLRDQCLYNVACAQSRLGRPDEALTAFAASVEHGLRDVVQAVSETHGLKVSGLSIAHILVDGDLDAIRELSGFDAALAPLVAGGSSIVLDGGLSLGGVAVVLLAADQEADAARVRWWNVLGRMYSNVMLVEGPIRPRADRRRWVLEDGDERFGVARLDAVAAEVGESPEVRVHVFADGDDAARVALTWAATNPARVAALALHAERLDVAHHADALAAFDVPLRIVLAGDTDGAVARLRDLGVDVVELSADEFPAGAERVLRAR